MSRRLERKWKIFSVALRALLYPQRNIPRYGTNTQTPEPMQNQSQKEGDQSDQGDNEVNSNRDSIGVVAMEEFSDNEEQRDADAILRRAQERIEVVRKKALADIDGVISRAAGRIRAKEDKAEQIALRRGKTKEKVLRHLGIEVVEIE